ncbi:hypothetical protein [Streptomyces sp. NPDC098781]|uniref:hypothetical protein n=1 Tax=Streptomyces sp. NPDC098781 TaxID=3366097 RepID=UPI00381081B2
MPELPDMGDTIPREGPGLSQYSFYRNALVIFGAVSPWIFIYVSTIRNPGLLWLPVLNLVGAYSGFYVMIRAWRRNQTRQLYLALSGSIACLIVSTTLFGLLN